MERLRIDIWSDIACPWCYVGKRRLERALHQFPRRDEVDIVWRAFELDPHAPRKREDSVSYAERLAKKYGQSVQKAEEMVARMTEIARLDGLDFRFDIIRPGNTFDAHRLLHLALERGVQDQLKERFLRGYLSEGLAIGDEGALASMAAEVGLAADEVQHVLGSTQFSEEVRSDEQDAARMGIGGVPCFIVGERYAVSGAQPADMLLGALERAYREVQEGGGQLMEEEGSLCGPDGCAI